MQPRGVLRSSASGRKQLSDQRRAPPRRSRWLASPSESSSVALRIAQKPDSSVEALATVTDTLPGLVKLRVSCFSSQISGLRSVFISSQSLAQCLAHSRRSPTGAFREGLSALRVQKHA